MVGLALTFGGMAYEDEVVKSTGLFIAASAFGMGIVSAVRGSRKEHD